MMKKIKLLLLFLVTTIGVSWAQIKVTGTVNSSDDNGPMPGVTILENGTSNGTVTDVNGTFSLNVASEASILTFSFVGYSSKEVPVANLTHIDVTLDLDVTELKEIVVIGYGQAKKEDLTGAIASVESKDFNKGVLTSPQDLLVGRLAGVQVTTNSGAPGAGATIRIRGGSSLTASNDPLIVIDGVPIDNTNVTGISNPLATINPNDIESFTVLKDASATAIYGSRASNGVIIITTKKGGGDKPSFAYNSRVSISQPIEYVDVLDGDEYRTLINQLYEDGFSGINQTAVDLLGDDNTDWQDKIFRTAISHDHNLSASGTLATIPYRISYGYTDQQGILKTTSTKRHSISLNLSPSLLNDNLKVNVNIKQSLAATNFGDEGAVGSAVNYDPTQPVYSGSDAFGGFFNYLNGARPNTFVSNPLAMLKLRNNTADVNRFIGNVKFNYTLPFFKDLSASLNLGLDKSRTVGVDDALPGTTWIYRDLADEFAETGRLLDYEAGNQSELLDFYLNYKKEVGVHELEVTAGYSWQHFSRDGFTFSRSGDEGFVIQSKEDTQFENENYLVSFFGRLNYILADKYLITATVRNDGSSRFVGDNQWGLFPALGLAWRISEEGFMSSVSAISSLKLRAGIGVTGQQDISNVPNPYYPGLPIYRDPLEELLTNLVMNL